MCGIVGFVGSWDYPTLKTMTSTLLHRGPDEEGYHYARLDPDEKYIGMGHRRLSIIDLSSGRQPIWNEDRTKAIIFNGEIYNYRILRRDLERAGHRFSTQSDTEVILHGFEEHGTDVVGLLEGMFAFTIWDQSTKSLFIARDRMGIKPLYYSEVDGGLIFASEIKALLPVLRCRVISKTALYHYLLYGFVMQGESMIKGVFHLPAANYLIWQDGKLLIKRYWSLSKKNLDVKNEAQWAELIRTELGKAVESHVVSDVPVGLTLSGGLDSSAVLALMSQATQQQRINAFTIGYGLPDDETRFSRIASGAFNIQSYESHIDLNEISEWFRRIIYHLEEPIAHPVLGTTFFLARAVRERMKVVLIGEGSDELFGGYPHYRLFRFPYSLSPNSLTRHFFFKTAYLMPTVRTYEALLTPEWLDRELLTHVSHMYDRYFSGASLADGGLRFELEHELVGNQLLRIDKLMMAHSVEARVPFLDHNFVEVAYSVPFSLKQKNGIEKYILRKAVEPLLPREIVYRPKSGKRGTQALLLPLVEQTLKPCWLALGSSDSVRKRGLFKEDALKKHLGNHGSLWARFNPIAVRQQPKMILALTILELWSRIFLDQEAA